MRLCFSSIIFETVIVLHCIHGIHCIRRYFTFTKNRFYLNDRKIIHALFTFIPSLLKLLSGDQLSVNFDSFRNLKDKAKFFSYEQTYYSSSLS